MVMDARGTLPFAFPFWGVILMGWMPGLAATMVAGVTGGRAAVRNLFARVLIWRVGWPWYLLVIGGTAAIWLSSVLLNPLFGGSGLQVPEVSIELLIVVIIQFVLLFLVNSEELVWRGSMLPRLQARSSALQASVLIGAFEGLFHLPLFFKPDSDQAATGLPVFVLGSIAGAIIFSWVFNNTLGSLLLVQLFHIFANTWITLFSAAPADNVISQWIFNGLLVAGGAPANHGDGGGGVHAVTDERVGNFADAVSAHHDDFCAGGFCHLPPINVRSFLGGIFMPCDERQLRGKFPMRQRNPSIIRHRHERRNSGHDFKIHARIGQFLCLLCASAKDIRVPAFQTHHNFP